MKDWIEKVTNQPFVAHAMAANERYNKRLGPQFAAGLTAVVLVAILLLPPTAALVLTAVQAAFFALGGYAMGMYLMRQIGTRGVYGDPVLPVGSLLATTPLDFPAEEIPREGVEVQAVPTLARRADGSYARWTGYRSRVGRGPASSGLASDDTQVSRG